MALKDSATDLHDAIDVSSDLRWQVADRAAHSSALKRAVQLQSILMYLVRNAILDPREPIREYEIACNVLGRRTDFNPIDDNIVRVQVGHLRKKLDLYFSTEGILEPIVITLERGSYTPVFTVRPSSISPSPQLESSLASTPVDSLPPRPPSDSASTINLPRRSNRLRWLAAFTPALALGIGLGFYFRPGKHTDPSLPTIRANPILSRIFLPGSVVHVVVADTTLVMLQNTVHTNISVAQYVDRSYPASILAQVSDPALRSALTDLTHHRYTSIDDADVVGQCFKWGSLLGAKTVTQYARDMHVRDFEQGNFVIVGSRRGNPWASLFDSDVNFLFEENPATHQFHFLNRKPAAGEPTTFEYSSQPDGQSIGYVDIVILPNATHTGSVLILDGFSMETNEAAANRIFSQDFPPELLRAIGTQTPATKVEILMRVHNLDGSEERSEVVAVRSDARDAGH